MHGCNGSLELSTLGGVSSTKWKRVVLLAAAWLISTFCCADDWELGGAGGFGFYHYANISAPAGSAGVALGSRLTLAGVAGKDFPHHLGGEFRFTYQDGDAELISGRQRTTRDGYSEGTHVDLLVYPSQRASHLKPFLSLGTGFKYYKATAPAAGLPLANFSALNVASQAEPLITLGGGIKYAFRRHWLLRLDFRDYTTPYPGNLITLAPGAKLNGWVHSFVFLVGVSHAFGGR